MVKTLKLYLIYDTEYYLRTEISSESLKYFDTIFTFNFKILDII